MKPLSPYEQFFAGWGYRNKAVVDLEAVVGGKYPGVGVVVDGCFPLYPPEVWTPPDAYFQIPCVAVMGRGAESVKQLLDWLLWFDENHFRVVTEIADLNFAINTFRPLDLYLGRHKSVRMIKEDSNAIGIFRT